MVAETVASRAGISDWKLVYQSRSGPGSVPWLEPDIDDLIFALCIRWANGMWWWLL